MGVEREKKKDSLAIQNSFNKWIDHYIHEQKHIQVPHKEAFF